MTRCSRAHLALLVPLLAAGCTRLGFAPPEDSGRPDGRQGDRGAMVDRSSELQPADTGGDRGGLPAGSACSSAAACETGQCVDGVCCDRPCGGACEACDQAGSAGTCLPLGPGEIPRAAKTGVCPASAAASCGPDGKCDGKGGCRSWPTGTTCLAPSCDTASNLFTPPASCDGKGSCVKSEPIACAPYRCSGDACRTSCSSDSHCTPGSFCVGASCGLKGAGATCATDSECASGFCVDAVCCTSACSEQCRACNLAGSLGTCKTLASGQPVGARTPCAGSGVCKGQCSGGTSCSYPTVSCRSASCSSSTTLTLAASCDGKGACPAVQTQPCTPYKCSGAACLTTCSADDECASTAFCSATATCTAQRPNGNGCTRARQCSSSFCVDGYCCNAACADACRACDVTGALGTCSQVSSGQPHGARTACVGAGTSCGGSCSSSPSCSYPSSAVSCSVCSGSGPFATTAGACDGAGSCQAGAAVTCGNYQCLPTLDGCRTSCSVPADCWNAYCEVATSSCLTCFPAGTPVLTPDGPRPIEQLREGELVLSFDTLAGRALARPIVAVERRRARRLLALRAGGATILTTPEHYFWVPAGGWVRARDLEAGDALLAPDGSERSFRAGPARSLARAVEVYNLVVREHNAYFVGTPPVLVHSCGTIGFSATRAPR